MNTLRRRDDRARPPFDAGIGEGQAPRGSTDRKLVVNGLRQEGEVPTAPKRP
jgi:hypothetical protein